MLYFLKAWDSRISKIRNYKVLKRPNFTFTFTFTFTLHLQIDGAFSRSFERNFWIRQNIAKNADIPRIPGIPGIPGITVTSQGKHRELLGQLIKNERYKLWNQIYIHNREKQTIKVARKTNLPTVFCPLLF